MSIAMSKSYPMPKPKPKPIIWTISGSDCSGGAGIAADIKTGHALGVEVCHLITANTVQNSTELISVNPVDIEVLQAQLQVLQNDKLPAVIKIGLVANLAQVNWLCQALIQLKQLTPALICVYDPVGQASVGGSFSTLTIKQIAPLLALIDVITPNLPEANYLAQSQVTDAKEENTQEENNKEIISVEEVAEKIYRDFAIKSIIIKGGHSNELNQEENYCIDYCYHQLNQLKQDNQDKIHSTICYQLKSPRIDSHYSHGGGCSFASAMAAFLAQGYLVRDAFTLTKAFINQGLAATVEISANQQHNYYGAFEQLTWPNNPRFFPQVLDESYQHIQQKQQKTHQLSSFPSLNLAESKLGLYPVIDSLYWLKRLLSLDLNIIQLRIKNLSAEKLAATIIEAIKLAKDYNTRLFINDYWQLAIKHGAYGVHIGQEDLAEADLIAIQKSGLRLGVSTHGCYEFLLAQQLQPSYLAIGAIFPTKTKDMTGQIQGLDNLKQVLALRPENIKQQIPVVAIGGINLERAESVALTGVDSIAVVTAITEVDSPEMAVSEFERVICER